MLIMEKKQDVYFHYANSYRDISVRQRSITRLPVSLKKESKGLNCVLEIYDLTSDGV